LCLYFSARLVVSDQWLHCRYGFWVFVSLSEERVRQPFWHRLLSYGRPLREVPGRPLSEVPPINIL
jgi:hypothetical protein